MICLIEDCQSCLEVSPEYLQKEKEGKGQKKIRIFSSLWSIHQYRLLANFMIFLIITLFDCLLISPKTHNFVYNY